MRRGTIWAQRQLQSRGPGANPNLVQRSARLFVTPLDHDEGMSIIVTTAVWFVGFAIVYSDWFELIPGRRSQQVVGWVVLGAFYVAFRFDPAGAGDALTNASSQLLSPLLHMFDHLPGIPTLPSTTVTTLSP